MGTLNRKQSLTLPPKPNCLDEIHLTSPSFEILGQKFWMTAIFFTSSGEWYCYICQSEVLLGDGTFRTAATSFVQIYVFYGTHEYFKIPVVWAFLGSKTEIYKILLQL